MLNTAARVADSMAGAREVAEGTTQPDVDHNVLMRAITWQGPQMIACSMVPKPIVTHPKDVIVQVTACAICSGSDLHFYAGAVPGIDPGFILGHEAMGIIVEKGEAVSKFNTGDRVVISCDIACGECDNCQRQEFSGCRTTNDSKLAENQFGHAPAAVFGFARMYGNVPGSQAEYVRVPIADVNCYLIPESIPDRKALYISDVLTTSLHAAELGEVKEGDTVCIWGLGPIGLNAIRWCQLKGAKRVIGIDLVKERIDLAKKTFHCEVLDRTGLSSEQVVAELNRQLPGGADVCIEAVGFRFDISFLHKMERAIGLETDTPEILYECFKVARPYGRISVIGDYAGTANHFPIGMIMMKHLTVASGPNPCQKYFKYVMDMLEAGEVDPTFMITHDITMEEVPTAYKMLFNKEDGIIKVFVRP